MEMENGLFGFRILIGFYCKNNTNTFIPFAACFQLFSAVTHGIIKFNLMIILFTFQLLLKIGCFEFLMIVSEIFFLKKNYTNTGELIK